MRAINLLASNNFITYNKDIAKKYGIEEAILLGVMCGYQSGFGEDEFYREQEQIIEDTALTLYSLRKAVKTLSDAGIIIYRKKGLPAKWYYKVNEERLLEDLRMSRTIENDRSRDVENDSTIINTNNNIKYNKIKINNKNKFTPPTKEEVLEYARTKNAVALGEKFYEYFTVGNWKDKNGVKVKNWKQKFLTWYGHTTQDKSNFSTGRQYTKEECNSMFQSLDEIEI